VRRAAKVDANQAAIVEALRACGASVQSLAAVGFGTFEEHKAADDALIAAVERLAKSGSAMMSLGEARQIITIAFFYREHAKALEDRVRREDA
jgi:hypothetical protein